MSEAFLIRRLKPCPFCGGAAVVSESSGWFGVGCETVINGVMCNGRNSVLQHKREAEAMAKWNIRALEESEPTFTIYVNRQILEEIIARGAHGAGIYRLVRTSPRDIEFAVSLNEQTK